ncbi:uncharacterized protein [Primulina huaijiensis]|uniref:uncharacterized protein isoform X1 n=1 Tax=Primulina huaijiensis TaxID=1492673 RepID=UPI003CC75953
MVSGSKFEGGAQVLSAGVRKTIQSIKEIVGNHSDADIYVALKETDMDPNETAQKLLNQDPFHEVKRKRDRKKESSGHKTFAAAETKNNVEVAHIPVKYNAYFDRNAQRGGYRRNAINGDAGAGREFRVVRDNRVNQNASSDSKLVQSTTSRGEGVISNGPVKRNSTGSSGKQNSPVGQHSSQALDGPADSLAKKTKDTVAGDDSKELHVEKRLPTPSADLRVQTKANDSMPYSASSNNSIVGVYSSSSDPVHVPSLHSKPAINVGAIRREVGVVGPRRHLSEISVKSSTFQSISVSNSELGRESHSRESSRPSSGLSKSDQSGQNMVAVSSISGPSTSRSFSSNQSGSRSHHQMTGHQRGTPLPNKEWKPKLTIKPVASTPVVIETSAKTVSPAARPKELKEEATEMQDNISRLTISENQNVIIAAHIRVSEADRYRLTFGSLGTESDTSRNLVFKANEAAEELSREPSGSVSVSNPEASGDELGGSKQLEMGDDSVQASGFNSPASDAESDSQLTEKKEASSPQKLENYADIGLVGDNPPSYAAELLHQDTSELSNFSGYDPHMGYDMPYFRPLADETVRGTVLPSSQEVLSSHLTNNTVPASTIAMVQQPQHQQQLQQQMAQMYPQLHVSHYANLMPYRQFLSPVYVPPMPLPGYSNSPAYPHPSNGSSYLLMPGNGTHISPTGLKYGVQQFKPVPTGGPTGYGNFTSPTGYAINTPGVGNTAGHEDSSRLKYNDSLYNPNPQAETSEIWMNPRELPSLQSASYYNLPGQTPHAAYLPSHAAAAAQSSHMQFSGMYHASPQPAAIGNHHHLGPAMGGNVGVGVAAPGPGAQVGAYHQPQLGHLNWAVNF